jgi:hypothetical protein
MRINRLIAPLAAAAVAVLTLGQAAHAELLINVNKSAQRMTVAVNGEHLYDWPVTTGGRDYDTPSGTFKPFRMEIDHYSDEYDNAPMPYSIFFTQTGNAIHGTYEQRNLGRPVSHGCVVIILLVGRPPPGVVAAPAKILLTGQRPHDHACDDIAIWARFACGQNWSLMPPSKVRGG